MSAPFTHRISTREQLERACLSLASLRAPQLPLFRAAADGLISLLIVPNAETGWPADTIKRAAVRPTVVLINDDPDIGDGVAKGPTQWVCANRLRYWAAAVVAHGAGGEAQHYREVIRAAEVVGRVALIETSSKMALPWAEFLRCSRTLLIVPRDGKPHPIRVDGGLH